MMTDLENFMTHVRNLKTQKVKQAVFDVNFLYQVVQQISPPPVIRQPVNKGVELDGGSFDEE